ncbi:Thyrostimulin beta-5 subunit [Amphibalanus amphitrite]|uniref:Thyrostimulin beta-5 subunit n=1 Tax=Amphibalanus amphitrite TaxID=1232801 RepID=A0A6A4VXG0_AMPAM|nr:thyrostimulin beta-5 subunit-like [Amphibalanus amphitrite]XP_043246451.1 thyrostimulin beta-5 subunit-like [Amphibalanus amphitrite]KAF0296284.1 Thyrostimulin beta-5 subunit [Amphibalanus amphitrite]
MAGGGLLQLLLPLLLLHLLAAGVGPAAGCEPRLDRPMHVLRRDPAGLACWGTVRAVTCWGHCQSHEVPDWRFPYRRSYHPVCMHGTVQLRTVTLPHCQPGAAAGTDRHTFLDAVSCGCAPCRGAVASCEGVRYRGTRRRSAPQPAP